MLTRLYIDNFRCFEKFEWKAVERKQLILGRNGTGKTSLMDALHYLAVSARREPVDRLFHLSQRTRWLDQSEQTFEVEAQLQGESYRYRLAIEPWGEPARPRVKSETLRLNDESILEFENGELLVYPGSSSSGVVYDLDRSRTALSDERYVEPFAFREWLADISCWHINPFAMGSRAEGEDMANLDLTNFPGWYRNLVKHHRKEDAAFLHDLRESLDGLDHLRFESDGGKVPILCADFIRDGGHIAVPFGELSDGQRCLICLYAIMHFDVANGKTVIIDEPDNFISLREIQPWLMAIEDMADDHKGQVILISHHPEILNQWANPYGVQFVRDGAGPVRVEKFNGDPEGSLTAAEVVAEGWDFD